MCAHVFSGKKYYTVWDLRQNRSKTVHGADILQRGGASRSWFVQLWLLNSSQSFRVLLLGAGMMDNIQSLESYQLPAVDRKKWNVVFECAKKEDKKNSF